MTDEFRAKLKTLPSAPGVYFHKNSAGEIIYVGKAAVLNNRVRSYFNSTAKDTKTAALIREIVDTDWMVTDSEMDALFLESEMVKRYKPKWNVLLRDDKNSSFVRIDMKSAIPTVTLTRHPLDDGADYYGPYYEKQTVSTALRILRKVFPYYDKPYTGKKTLNTDLGLTPGIELLELTSQLSPSSPEAEKLIQVAQANYKTNLRKLISYIKGNRTKVIKDTEREMKAASRAGNYELAATLRNQYFGLRGLSTKIVFSDKEFLDLSSDAALLELQKLLDLPKPPTRIDGFDISHQSGHQVVGSMVTFINGVADRRLYRRFKLRKEQNNDFENMREIVARRLRHLSDWGRPDLILIDGGQPQLRAVEDLLASTGIPFIGLAKEFEAVVIPKSVFEKTADPESAIEKLHMETSQTLKTWPDGLPANYRNKNHNSVIPDAENLSEKSLYGASAVYLPKSSHLLKLLQRIRDESHRFAITYHSLLKSKSLLGKK